MTGPVVLTVGSLHHDIMVEADHLPRRDETAVGSRWYPKFGGKGGNQALAAARAGVASRMLGAVGDDGFGAFLRHHLQAGGVDDRAVATLEGQASGMSVAIMDPTGDYAATIVSGANLHIDSAGLKEARLWQDVAVLILQNEVPESINLAAALDARRRGIRTVLNAAPCRPLSPDLAALVDVLVVNAVEAEMMGTAAVCCLPSAAEAARTLAAAFETVIVTAGAAGLALWTETDDLVLIAAEKVRVVSTHGAGDVFVGTFAASCATGKGVTAAAQDASQAAARHVAGQTV